jgi:lipid II:glycine glycyltransferase (peptidoglycan interpeptide bridge formation enzyme)
MKIKIISESDKEKYEELSLSYGSIFNTYQWLKNFDNISIYGIFDRGNSLIGGFHLFKERRFGLTIYRNPPFTPLIGPFIKIDTQNTVKVISKYREVVSLLDDFLDKLNYSIISVSLGRNIVDTLPFIWKKFKVIPGYTYVLDLNKSLDELNKGMSVKRRNDINKAIRDELIVKKIDDF